MAKRQASKFREFVKKRGADELYQQYFREKNADKLSRGVLDSRGSAERSFKQASEILKTLRFHEYYIEELRREHKQKVESLQRQVSELVGQVEKLKKLNEKLKRQRDAYKEEKLAAERAKDEKTKKKVLDVVSAAQKQFDEKKKQAVAKGRGDGLGEAVAKDSHHSKDKYEKLLKSIEKYGVVVMHENRRKSLVESSEFRQAFRDYFSNLTDDQLDDLWAANFGEGTAVFKSSEASSKSDVSWSYTPRRRK